jgi:hypothetical protein
MLVMSMVVAALIVPVIVMMLWMPACHLRI